MLLPLAAPIGKDGMVTLAHFIMWFLLAWLAALAAVVLLRSLGQGRLRELLHTTKPDGGTGGAIDPERVQLVVVSLGAIGLYFVNGIQAAATGPIIVLPEASDSLTSVLAGGNTLYTVNADIEQGQADDAIAKRVETDDINLVVMGAYGHSRIRSLIIGSTTTEMVRSCKVPVMLFR